MGYNQRREVSLMLRISCVLTLCVLAPVFAQTERGNITGLVKDPSGAAIASAEVTATHLSTNQQIRTVSTAAGDYNLPVPPGIYRVTVMAPGFKRYAHPNVNAATASAVRLDAPLELRPVNDSVQEATEVQQIQTEPATSSTTL